MRKRIKKKSEYSTVAMAISSPFQKIQGHSLCRYALSLHACECYVSLAKDDTPPELSSCSVTMRIKTFFNYEFIYIYINKVEYRFKWSGLNKNLN
jgi:hypothetical protein